MRTELEQLRELHAIQGTDGTWDHDLYLLGLFNGLELALATMEDRDPIYKNVPSKWGKDKNR